MPARAFPNAATPAGSEPYYTVRFAPPQRRDALARRFAWWQELVHIADRATDPGVARLKLDWWREELARARAGSPRHPLAEALAPDLDAAADLSPWLGMLDGAEARILKQQPADAEAFARACALSGGNLGELLARAIADTPAGDVDFARRLGTYAEAVWRVRDLAHHLARQWCPLPADLLREARLTPDRLHETRHAAALADALDRVLAPLRVPRPQLRAARDRPAATAARFAAQAAALHRALARRRYPVLHERVELTPLRRLWAAWRLS